MLLLDTHVLYWLVCGEVLAAQTLELIAATQDAGTLYVSAITAWELGVALRKREGPPALGMTPDRWFRRALEVTGARLATITPAVAAEAAAVPAIYGREMLRRSKPGWRSGRRRADPSSRLRRLRGSTASFPATTPSELPRRLHAAR